MINQNTDDDEDRLVDPRKARSRARLLDAATSLLSTGGIEAVTIDAVAKASKVARTTLYRHFSDSTQLLAAAFERLLPPVTAPPASGTIREQLIELLDRQAKLIEEAPAQLTMLGWLALGSAQPGTAGATSHPEEPEPGQFPSRTGGQPIPRTVRPDPGQPRSPARARSLRHQSRPDPTRRTHRLHPTHRTPADRPG